MENFLDKLKKSMMGLEAPVEIPMAPEQPEALEEAQTAAETAQINDQAKSPNLMTKPELAQKQVQQEVAKTVPGQLQDRAVASEVVTPVERTMEPKEMSMQDKLKANIARYEDLVNKKEKPPELSDKMQDAFSALHNILNYSSGSQQKNLATDNYAKKQAGKSKSKQAKLGNLQKLQGLYNDYAKSQQKDGISAYQQAQLDQGQKGLDLKEKLAKLAAKTKTQTSKKKNSKLEDEREKAIAKRFTTLEEQVPNKISSIDEAKFLMGELEKGNISTGPGSKLAGNIGGFFDTEESSLKERLDSLAEKAARAQLKANGETRPTDADVEGMKKAMFNLGNTESTNMEKLQDFIRQQESGLDEYQQMKTKLDNGEGLEDFKLKPTYESKDAKSNEVKRRTKDGQVAVFDKDTKKFLRYE